MTRLYGWAPRGKRLIDKVPHGHWKTSTFLAALRNDRIEAPCPYNGPINGERFLAYVEQFLVPTLKRDDIVISTISAPTKAKPCARRSALSSASYVPAQVLARPQSDRAGLRQTQGFLRKTAARTYDAVSNATANILDRFPAAECAAYLRNAGYA